MSEVDEFMLVLRIQQRTYGSLFSYFRVRIGLQFPDFPDALESKVSIQTQTRDV